MIDEWTAFQNLVHPQCNIHLASSLEASYKTLHNAFSPEAAALPKHENALMTDMQNCGDKWRYIFRFPWFFIQRFPEK